MKISRFRCRIERSARASDQRLWRTRSIDFKLWGSGICITANIPNPKLILADEPTGNLHSSQGEEIMELFQKLNAEGTTIIQVTHSEKNAGYGNRVIQLRDGWVVEGNKK